MNAPISPSGVQTATQSVSALAGGHILKVAQNAIDTAREHGEPVSFDFNGETIICTPDDSAEAVMMLYSDTLDERRRVYEASPEGKAAAEQDRRDRAARQLEVNRLLAQLPLRVRQGLPQTLRWLTAFTPAADWAGLEYDTAAVADLLSQVAPENAHVGRNDLEQDPEAMGEYIVGQAVNCLRRGMGPHPMVAEFVRRWEKL